MDVIREDRAVDCMSSLPTLLSAIVSGARPLPSRGADRRRLRGQAGEHLRDMANPHVGAPPMQPAGDVEQTTEVAAEQRTAPVASTSSALPSTIFSEISGYLTQNKPPKPQQTRRPQLLQRQSGDAGEQGARLRLYAQLTQAGAES